MATALALGSAAGGAASGAGSGIASLLSTKSQEKLAKKQMKQQRRIHEESTAQRQMASEMVLGAQSIAERNLLATEQARMNILGALGQPGSYGPSPGSATGPISLGSLRPTGVGGSLFGAAGRQTVGGVVTGEDVKLKKKASWKGRKPWEVSGASLDPDAMAAEVMGTSAFRNVSRMVAEAEQMMNREGPLWDQLNNSVVGSIYESSAAMQRSAMEQVARSIARGGTARRAGLASAEAMRVQEQVNRDRTGQLWQAKMGLEEYRIQSSQQVTAFAQEWVNNASGVRDSFTNALTSLQMFWSSTMAPVLAGATMGAQSATQQGMLNAGAGMVAAAQSRGQAIGGMVDSLAGLGTAIGGYFVDQAQNRSVDTKLDTAFANNPDIF